MRIEWKSNLHGIACCPTEYKLIGEGDAAGTFEAYVTVFGTPDRPDLFGDSDVIEPTPSPRPSGEGPAPVTGR